MSLQNPEVTYALPGSYTVTLTAFAENGGQASVAKTGYITVKRTARVSSIAFANTAIAGGISHDTESRSIGRKRDWRRHRHDEPLSRHGPG